MRWTWIDRFVAFESGKTATAIKNLSLAEDHFADHFPGFPVMPAPLILEGLAQTGGILVGEARQYRENVVLAKMSNAKFHRDALAGEQLTYTTALIDLNDTGAGVRDGPQRPRPRRRGGNSVRPRQPRATAAGSARYQVRFQRRNDTTAPHGRCGEQSEIAARGFAGAELERREAASG